METVMNTNRPKHLLHVFATFKVGGPQVRSCQILNHFGTNYTHTIIAMDDDYQARTLLTQDLSVQFVPLSIDKRRTFRNVWFFRTTLAQVKPDILITYNWGAIEWAISNYIAPLCPHIHLEEGFRTDEILVQKKRRILFRRLFLAHTFRVVVPSLVLKEIAVNIWKLPLHKVEYIPNGIDCTRFTQKKKTISRQKEIIIGTVAGLRKVKNIPRLIYAFSRLAADTLCKLWIVGDGSERESISQLIAELNLSNKVRLFGHLEDPSSLIKQFDIFAISSDTEQMPITLLEAMASGLPIVGTDVGDIKEMVAEPNKHFIVPTSPEQRFQEALQTLVIHDELRERLGKENRQKCERSYSNHVMFENYATLFESALLSGKQR